MKKPNPSGRTKLIGDQGRTLAEGEPDPKPDPLPEPEKVPGPVPRSHGKRDWETLDRIGKARRANL